MKDMVLFYVKSEKIYVTEYTMPNLSGGGHWCSAGYRAQQTLRRLSPDQQKAKEALDKAGIAYRLIDLGEAGAAAKIKAKLKGINETPTLILDAKKVRGTENILGLIESLRK